jgi:type II secretory pathway pseudopilin PulG
MTIKQKFSRIAGFSLVEVIVALGIVAFAFVGLLGIIPSGLSSFRQSVDQARALTALNMVASAVRNSKFDKIDLGNKKAYYKFPQFFSDSSSAASFEYWTQQDNWGARFLLLEDGSIYKKLSPNSPAPKAALYLVLDPPGVSSAPAGNNMAAGPLVVNAFVVWPYRSSLDGGVDDNSTIPSTRAALAARIGTRSFLDTVITHYPEPVQ